jgi:lipoprotein Spr
LREIIFKYKLIIILAITVFSTSQLSARRHFNPELTKKKAIEMIRANSEEVSELAGFEPLVVDSNFLKEMHEESELLSDTDLDEEEAKELAAMQAEDENYEDVDVNVSNFEKQWLSFVSEGESSTFTENGLRKDQIMESILGWLGTPYKFGGTSRKSIDCSAFTQSIFVEAAEVKLPRTANWQFTLGEKIDSIEDLQFGDLIFFHTRSYARASHCGIYLGDNLFAHASSRYGVTVSSLQSSYYNKCFIGGRRLTDDEIMQMSTNKEKDEQPETKFGG